MKPRIVDALSVVLGAAALLFAAWPVGTRDATAGPMRRGEIVRAAESRALSRAQSLPGAMDSTVGAAGEIVQGNLFSATRRAPGARFTPPGSELEDPSASAGIDTSPAGSANAAAEQSAGDADDAGPRLFGIVSVDGVRRALLALRAGEPPRLLAAGEQHAGYRVVAIHVDRVQLAGAGGPRTLRLARPAARDSFEIQP